METERHRWTQRGINGTLARERERHTDSNGEQRAVETARDRWRMRDRQRDKVASANILPQTKIITRRYLERWAKCTNL